MISLGLRLTLSGGREAAARLVMIAVAVTVGVALLLITIAGLNAVNHQNARYAWLETGAVNANAPASGASGGQHDPLWWRIEGDYFRGKEIGRVDVAATGPNAPIPPGISALPAAGQYYASPALAKLLRTTPASQLADRYPGRMIGTIGAAALPAPNSLIVVVGRSVAELAKDPHADEVNRISTTSPSSCADGCVVGAGINGNGITLILSVVIAGLFFPVLVFIGGATRLSAARREQRFAAMRLVGATPRQISVLSAVESSVAAVLGVVGGFALFFALRPAVAAIPFTGDPFYTSDLTLSTTDIVLVALGIPIAAALAARIALRRVRISPLGLTRRVTPPPPSALRVVPLIAGLAELGYFAYVHYIGASSRAPVSTEVAAFLSGILLTMGGLVLAGPWLTMISARLMAARASRPATLIAARRLADNPRAGFRAISGLVLALFVGSCALGVITTVAAYDGGHTAQTSRAGATLVVQFRQSPDSVPMLTPADAATFARVKAVDGVTGVAAIHFQSDAAQQVGQRFFVGADVVLCSELAGVPALGHCPPGADAVLINPDYGGAIVDQTHSVMSKRTWLASPLTASQVQQLPLDNVAVGTDGTTAAVEQARTILDNSYSQIYAPQTMAEYQANGSKTLNSYKQLANVIILTSLPIAGCSLAVSVAGGLSERKRPFSLLRLTGTPLSMLRRVVTLETAAPLLVAAVVAAGTGLLAAQLFLRAQLAETLQPPSAQYYGIVVAGLIASVAVVASTLPLLRRITGPETARND